MVTSLVKVSALAVVVLTASTKAHNQMTVPVATWPDGFYNKNNPSGTIDSEKVLPVPKGMTYKAGSDTNSEAYWTAFNASKYKSLKEMAFATQTLAPGATNECGFALIDGEPQELPDMVEWDQFGHQGPCEVWCDETLVFQNADCAVNYKETPAKLPYDKAKCAGASVLASHWLALHAVPWQIYSVCAALVGGSGGKNSSTPAAATPATPSGSATPPATPSEAATPSAASEADEADSKETESGDSGTPASPSESATPPATPSEAATPPATPSGAATPPATPSEAATPPAASEAEEADSKETNPGDAGTPATPSEPATSPTPPSEAATPPATPTESTTPTSLPNDKCSVRRRH